MPTFLRTRKRQSLGSWRPKPGSTLREVRRIGDDEVDIDSVGTELLDGRRVGLAGFLEFRNSAFGEMREREHVRERMQPVRRAAQRVSERRGAERAVPLDGMLDSPWSECLARISAKVWRRFSTSFVLRISDSGHSAGSR